MRKHIFFIIFISIAQLLYGQENYTIQGELPEHSLDNTYLSLTNSSALSKELLFLEKYAQYPDVVRFQLSHYLNRQGASENPDLPKYRQIIDRMPKADRDILLAWLDYSIKKREYEAKVQPLLDSIRNNAPRFIETIPNSSPSTTIKNEQSH